MVRGADQGISMQHISHPVRLLQEITSTQFLDLHLSNATAMVVDDVNPLPYAGGNGIFACPEAAAVPLSVGWKEHRIPLAHGQPRRYSNNGIFDPGTDPQGAYTYTV